MLGDLMKSVQPVSQFGQVKGVASLYGPVSFSGGGGDGNAIPPAPNLGECNHFDCDGDSARRAARDGDHPPSACFYISAVLARVAWALAGSPARFLASPVAPLWTGRRWPTIFSEDAGVEAASLWLFEDQRDEKAAAL